MNAQPRVDYETLTDLELAAGLASRLRLRRTARQPA